MIVDLINSTTTIYEQYYYNDNCTLPFNKTRENKIRKKRNADAEACSSAIQTAP